jgi:replicative DNA helicase
MSANGSRPRPTAEDVRASFDAAGDLYEAQPVPDDVVISERAVIGSAIQSTALAAEALDLLEARHFSRNAHQVVFAAIARVFESGRAVDPVSVMAELARAGTLASIGDHDLGSHGAYLHSLAERRGDIRDHAPRILAESRRQALRDALVSARALIESDGYDPDVHPDKVRALVEDATAVAAPSSLRPNSETVTEVLDALEHDADPGLSTGYPDLDDAIGGLRPKEVIIVGGRPGQGKTLLGLCIADHVGTRLGLPVLFASLEMTEAELTLRRIAAEAKVPYVNLVRHQVTEDDWHRISRASDRLLDTGLHIDDASQAPASHIRRQLRAMARMGKPARLLVIDYLGYIAAPSAESRQQAVAENVRQVEKIAAEFSLPVILLAQLNRGPEQRADKRPVPADLRETGEAEQTADIAILIHREDAYEPESPRAGEVDLIVAKNRQGPLCTVTLAFQGHYGRIVSLTEPVEWTPSSAVGGWNE